MRPAADQACARAWPVATVATRDPAKPQRIPARNVPRPSNSIASRKVCGFTQPISGSDVRCDPTFALSNPSAPGNVGRNPSLYFYVMSAIRDLTPHPHRRSSAYASVLFGLLAVVAVYLIGRRVDLGSKPALAL